MYLWLRAIVHIAFDQEVATVDIQEQFEPSTHTPFIQLMAHGMRTS